MFVNDEDQRVEDVHSVDRQKTRQQSVEETSKAFCLRQHCEGQQIGKSTQETDDGLRHHVKRKADDAHSAQLLPRGAVSPRTLTS